MDKYEKLYNEALKRAKAAIDIAADKDLVKGVATTIFPELYESEDERIRKKCIELIKRVIPSGDSQSQESKEILDCVAYLEEQKEQKPIPDWMPKFLDELRSKKNYFDWDEHRDIEGQILAIINWIAPDYFKRKEEKKPDTFNEPYNPDDYEVVMEGNTTSLRRKEQKPIDNGTREKIISRATSEKQVVLLSESDGKAEIGWDTRSLEDAKKLLEYGLAFINKNGIKPAEKQDYSGLTDLERAIHRGFLSAGIENVPVTIIKETAKECLALKPVEWLDEDEVYLQDALWCVEQAAKVARGENDMGACWSAERWLKSLRPQPKQEWSEKEKKILDSLICLYSSNYSADAWPWADGAITYGDVTNLLKSLRPQPHWKPSEEQMEALESAVKLYKSTHFEIHHEKIVSLYEQLKKLM